MGREAIGEKIKSALVTGGGGFAGQAIVRQLVAAGVETRVIGRNRYPILENAGVSCIVGDICDRRKMNEAAEGVDVVFHAAALAGIWGHWQDYYRVNVDGAKSVIEACLQQKVPALVYTSTPSVVFDGEDIRGGDESLAYSSRPLCNYARSKIIAEKMVLAKNSAELATCALRPHLIWGPGDPHLLPRLVAKGRAGQLRQVGTGDNTVDLSYVENVAHGHLLAAKNLAGGGNARGKAYFLSDGAPVNLWDWVNGLFAELAIKPVKKSVSYRFACCAGSFLEGIYNLFDIRSEPGMTRFLAQQLAFSHHFSIQNAVNDLGYHSLTAPLQAFDETVNWLKSL